MFYREYDSVKLRVLILSYYNSIGYDCIGLSAFLTLTDL